MNSKQQTVVFDSEQQFKTQAVLWGASAAIRRRLIDCLMRTNFKAFITRKNMTEQTNDMDDIER
jgi:hypothetical protein